MVIQETGAAPVIGKEEKTASLTDGALQSPENSINYLYTKQQTNKGHTLPSRTHNSKTIFTPSESGQTLPGWPVRSGVDPVQAILTANG
jgi:hypothetical protein